MLSMPLARLWQPWDPLYPLPTQAPCPHHAALEGQPSYGREAWLLVVLVPCDDGPVLFLPSLSFHVQVERGAVGP